MKTKSAGTKPGRTRAAAALIALLAVALSLLLAACGGGEKAPASTPQSGADREKYAGTYTFLYMKISADMMIQMLDYDGEPAQNVPAQYVQMPNMTGWTVTLEPDGTGSLFWGEDNQGPIDQWTVDGGRLTFHAGVSEAEGTVKDGVMELALEEGLNAFFALPGAESTGVTPITPEDYFLLLYGDAQ